MILFRGHLGIVGKIIKINYLEYNKGKKIVRETLEPGGKYVLKAIKN